MRTKVRSFVARMWPGLDQRGSALLVTLMVLVGLSLLGLTFVAFTETESAISVNERNAAQTLSVAEAGGKAVVEWFENPTWALAQGLAPANDPNCSTSPCIKILRQVSSSAAPTTYSGTSGFTGYYKSGTTDVLFDKSFRDQNGMFYGTENNPDILINDKTAPVFLNTFNILLFNSTVPGTMPTTATATSPCISCDNTQGGRITEIRIYAPPIDGGYTNSAPGWTTAAGIPGPNASNDSFTNGGARFGVATIRVTAAKYATADCGPYKSGCVATATKTAKFVIAEWPIPGPGGPVQSATDLTNAGNVNIHWGRSTSEGNLDLTKSQGAVPWHDAYNIANIERGYDPNVWPVLVADPDYKKQHNWLNELIGRSWTDPWWGARARGLVAQLSNTTQPQPQTWNMADVTTDPTTGSPAQSNLFQLQTMSDGVYRNEVLFPHIDYNFWKQVAMAGANQRNVKYLKWSSADSFTDISGCTQTFLQWVDTSGNTTPAACAPASKPGFYFFDTTDGANPQLTSNPTNLTPGIQISGSTFQMAGFIYLNASDYKTTGASGVSGYYNMPGEPYRDVGFLKVGTDSSRADYQHYMRQDVSTPCVPLPSQVNCVLYGAGNGKWDFQDLPWSNGGTAVDNKFNVFVQLNSAAIARSSPTTPIAANSQYFVVPWFDGCNPGDNGVAGVNCSEPHEPYLNLVYPTSSSPGGSSTAMWENPSSQTRRPKVMNGASPVTCTAASPPSDCTSNGYDMDGALVQLSPVLNGVFYTEGTDSSTGNAVYFGSLLIKNTFDNKGTPDVWFDEKLIKGEWPPSTFNFPRVYVSTEEIGQ